MSKKCQIIVLLLVCLTLSVLSPVGATPFGVAGDFNVYSLGNIEYFNSDFEGIAGAGGNITLDDFAIGWKLPSSSTYSLIAGGDIQFSHGSVFHGGIEAGGAVNLSNMYVQGSVDSGVSFSGMAGTIEGDVHAQGMTSLISVYVDGAVNYADFSYAFDHSAIADQLIKTSNDYAAMTANRTLISQFDDDVLIFSGESGLNVFDVTAAELQADHGTIRFVGPADATFVLNISGRDLTIINKGFELDGVDKEKILFNAYEANSLEIRNIGIPGTVLAPHANTQFEMGRIDGSLFVGNLTGGVFDDGLPGGIPGGQVNLYTFTGEPPSGVPEPATILLMGSGLGILFYLKKVRG